MMRYNVSQLLKDHIGAMRQYELHEDITDLDPSLKPLTDVNGSVDMIRTSDGILVRANLYTNVELTCSRCLTQFSIPVRFKIDEEFLPSIDITTGARLPKTDDTDEATLIDGHHLLDLTEVLRQDLILALPIVPVCRNDCQGLCASCGQNLNEGDCDCTEEQLDPRFAALQQLLDESNLKNN